MSAFNRLVAAVALFAAALVAGAISFADVVQRGSAVSVSHEPDRLPAEYFGPVGNTTDTSPPPDQSAR
ncbi:MAG: hypothetical protein AB7F96_02065 [Beijerinckiaceae bacterium]